MYLSYSIDLNFRDTRQGIREGTWNGARQDNPQDNRHGISYANVPASLVNQERYHRSLVRGMEITNGDMTCDKHRGAQ